MSFDRKDWHRARDHFSNAIQYAELAPQLLLRRAWCSYYMGDMYEAIADAGKALRLETENIPALELRGGAYYVLGEFEMAMNHYRSALKSDPEHKGCKEGYRLVKKITGSLDKASKAMAGRDFNSAIKHFNSVIDIDPQHRMTVPKSRLQLAEAHMSLKQFAEAKKNAQAAIDFDGNSAEAYRVYGKVHLEAEEFEEAVQKMRRARELNENDEGIADDLRRAEAALKQSKQKDYYKILGVSRRATEKEIKKAYREKALEWHPDKHSGEEEKEKAEKQFQLIAEAYEILSDEDKRQRYDRGEDVTGQEGHGGGGGPHGFNPFQHFQQHMGGFQHGQQHFFHFGG